MSLNLTLASRNLFHDRLRFVATTIGIVFSVVLIMVQMGLYLGFGQMVTAMVDHANTDLWVVRKGTKCFEDTGLIDTDMRKSILAVKGVAQASTVVIGYTNWRLPNGETTPVFVVGADMKSDRLRPWNIVDGSVKALEKGSSVAVDRSYKKRLGVSKIGEKAEIRGRSVEVVALTDGIRAFTTTPYVFVDLDHARTFIGIRRSKASYILVTLKSDADLASVRHELRSGLKNVEVLTSAQFKDRSHTFWLFGTGAGAALFGGALLGLIVGTVIVAQTLYSSTKDHLDEFATLRAIGSSKGYIYRVIVSQALINAVIGFCFASLVGFAVVRATSGGALPVVITPQLMGVVFALTGVMCVISALAAILRVVRLDPAMVFTR